MSEQENSDEVKQLLDHLIGENVPPCGEGEFPFRLLKRPKARTFACTAAEARNKLIDDALARAETRLKCKAQTCPKRGFTCAPFFALWDDDWVRVRPYRAKDCAATTRVGYMATWRSGRAFLLACTCVPDTF